MSAIQEKQSRGTATRVHLKQTAERLFAQSGIDGVSVRDIVEAAGLRNAASLHYYFGSKEELVKALIIDGAREAHEWRSERLEELEARSDIQVRDVIEILLWPVLEIDPLRFATETHMRFLNHVITVNRKLYLATVAKKWDQSYQRCLALLREMIDVPEQILNERFIFNGVYLRSIFASREADVARRPQNNFWNRPQTIKNLMSTVEAMFTAPSSSN